MNENNEIISSYMYDAFGNLMEGTIHGGDLKYQYTGQEYEDELDLHNFRARFYDSDLMRFPVLTKSEVFQNEDRYVVDPAIRPLRLIYSVGIIL